MEWQNTEDLEQMATVQINIFIYLQLSTNVDLSFKKRSIMHKGHYDCDHSAEDSDLGTMSQVDMGIPKYLSRIGFSGPTEPRPWTSSCGCTALTCTRCPMRT